MDWEFLHRLSFANPWWMLSLLAIPLIAILHGRRGNTPAVSFSSTAQIRALGKIAKSRAGKFARALSYLALALLIVALARPQIGNTITETHASGTDIMIALDVSGSMLTKDYTVDGEPTSRVDVVKEVTRKFIEGRPNDRIGLIVFGAKAYLVSPLTMDHDWLLRSLSRVKIGTVNSDATAIGSAMVAGANRLRSDEHAKSKTLILLTDGENNAGEVNPDTAAEAIKTFDIHFYSIGAGTNGIAPVPVGTDYNGNYVYQNAQVTYDAAGLRKIAEIAHGHYFRASDVNAMESIFHEIDKMEKSSFQVKRYQQYRDLYPWFVGAGLALLILQWLYAQTLGRRLP